MKHSKEDVLKRIQGLSHVADFAVAEKLLQPPDTEYWDLHNTAKLKPAEERINDPHKIVRTWNARVRNATRTGFNLYGGAELVEALKSLPANVGVFSLVFRNPKMAGHFFFAEKTWEPVGFVIVDLLDESQNPPPPSWVVKRS
jgi:hypothetical protein